MYSVVDGFCALFFFSGPVLYSPLGLYPNAQFIFRRLDAEHKKGNIESEKGEPAT